jgi:hypothetical protein
LEGSRRNLVELFVGGEVEKTIREFHKGDCGGHHYWKTTVHKILRAGFYWPSIFSDVYKEVSSCHECQIFYGKRKLQPFPLKPISVEAPFRQWGLDFIGEIHPQSSAQHKWILTATYYFTKWIEAVPTRQATYTVIIQFLENNILSRFGCPIKIITDNATTFKSKKMEKFCSDYNITLGHSTSYYPQGNGLVESSNKSLTRIIKKCCKITKRLGTRSSSMHYGLTGSLLKGLLPLHPSRLCMAQRHFSYFIRITSDEIATGERC